MSHSVSPSPGSDVAKSCAPSEIMHTGLRAHKNKECGTHAYKQPLYAYKQPGDGETEYSVTEVGNAFLQR